jgi:hypothetical protein
MPEPSERQQAQDARTAALRDPQPEPDLTQPPVDTAESVQADQEALAADDTPFIAAQITPDGVIVSILIPWSGVSTARPEGDGPTEA